MKANFSQILPYFSLNIPLRSLYRNFNCSNMLLWSTVIKITQIQLPTNTHFWVIDWKPHIEIFPGRPPCNNTIWLTEVKSYNSRTAITHFLTPGTITYPKITMRVIHPRWYRPTPLAHGLTRSYGKSAQWIEGLISKTTQRAMVYLEKGCHLVIRFLFVFCLFRWWPNVN